MKQCTTLNYVSYHSTSSHKLLFRIIVKYYALCLYVWKLLTNIFPPCGELFHIFGTLFHNCSTKSGTVPLCVGLLGYCRLINIFSQKFRLLRITWTGCLPQDCLPQTEHKELGKWIRTILSENASKSLNSTMKLESGRIYCEENVSYDVGSYIAASYLAVVLLLVLLGGHL